MSTNDHRTPTRFPGFEEVDFDVFAVPGLQNRMEKLKAHLRPKLELLGNELAEVLSVAAGKSIYAHVAKHARRTTNPPNDSWVAFSEDVRGYKKWPTFMVGAWQTHLFVQFGIIYESPRKSEFAQTAADRGDAVLDLLPGDFLVYDDHTRPTGILLNEMDLPAFRNLALTAAKKRQGDLLFGKELPRMEAVAWDGERTLDWIKDTLKVLAPVYHLVEEGRE